MELVQRIRNAHQHGIELVRKSGKLDLLKRGSNLLEAHDISRGLKAVDRLY